MVQIKATIVLDTSGLLDALHFIQSLARGAIANATELLVPREVIKELDIIKDRETIRSQLGSNARAAINWINSLLSKQDIDETPALRGQKYSETIDKECRSDDSILDCALYNARNTGRLTILLSEDHNLCNKAVIEGIETLEANAPGVTAERVFEAIAQRTMNEMDLDDWAWEQPQPSSPIEEGHMLDEQMLDEPSVVPANNDREMPLPVSGPDMQSQIMQNLSILIDWHLRGAFSDEELHYLKYRVPKTSSQFGQVLKKFSLFFNEIVPTKILHKFINAVKRGVVDKEYILLHVKLLQALSLYSTEYQTMIAKYLHCDGP